MVFIDTNVVMFLYDALLARLSERVKKLIEEDDVYMPAMVKLELSYLQQIKRVRPYPDQVMKVLQKQIGIKIAESIFENVVDKAANIMWTRDPFDRLIVAEADLYKAPLVTSDRLIIENYKRAVW